ncbi:hypothetical protein EV363DRAFT_498527 [Boletus edulis]|nr:hypothetical protein EV363DRAFT_498527 [Boletus edulis]
MIPTVITVVKCDEDALKMRHLQPLLDAKDRVLGVAATYGKQCQLSSIAFSTLSHVLVVNIPARHVPQPKGSAKQQQVAKSRGLIQDYLLVNPKFQKHAFKMDQFATALHLDLSIRVNDAVDMLSVAVGSGRGSLEAFMNTMGGETQAIQGERTIPVFRHFKVTDDGCCGWCGAASVGCLSGGDPPPHVFAFRITS